MKASGFFLLAAMVLPACATQQREDEFGDSEAAFTSCDVAFENQAIVVFRTASGFTFAPKTLAVEDVLVTPPNPQEGAFQTGPFSYGRVDYTIVAASDPAALAAARSAIGAEPSPASFTIDARNARVALAQLQTSGGPDPSASFAAVAGRQDALSLHVEKGLFFHIAPRRSALTSVTATATVTCGDNAATRVALATATPVAYHLDAARVYVPSVELNTIMAFNAEAASLRDGGNLHQAVAAVSPEAIAAAQAFVQAADREVGPANSQFGVDIDRHDLQARVARVFPLYKAFMNAVLAAGSSGYTADTVLVPAGGGRYKIAAGATSAPHVSVHEVLFGATELRSAAEALATLDRDEITRQSLVP